MNLSPRPSPPSEQVSSKTLHPIYQALDTHNYTKALKLTAPSSNTVDWDIIRALRIHALERSGKVKESLILLWELLVGNVVLPTDDKRDVKDIWSELYQKIVSLSDVEDVINNNDKSSSGLDIQLMDAVQRLDVRAYTPIQLPTSSSSTVAASSTQTSASSKPAAAKSKSKKGKSKSKKTSTSTPSTATSTTNINLPPITDETVLSTISVTLRTLNMSDTISYMYYIAVETLSSSDNGMKGKSKEEMENYASVLEESVVVHLKAVCDCSNVTIIDGTDVTDCTEMNDDRTSSVTHARMVQSGLSKLEVALRLTKYYERMQSCRFCLYVCLC